MMTLRKIIMYMNNGYLITNQRHLLVELMIKQFEHFDTVKETYDYAMDKYDETFKSHFMEAFSAYVN